MTPPSQEVSWQNSLGFRVRPTPEHIPASILLSSAASGKLETFSEPQVSSFQKPSNKLIYAIIVVMKEKHRECLPGPLAHGDQCWPTLPKPPTRIPEPEWLQAKAERGKSCVHEIASVLGLDGNQLKPQFCLLSKTNALKGVSSSQDLCMGQTTSFRRLCSQ